MPALVALAYYLGAEAAFVVGTLSDKIFAPFWPPNIILLCALLFTPRSRWWIFVVATFPAHLVAELGIGMGFPQLLVAYITNILVAVFGALALVRLLGNPPKLGSLRAASIYVLVAAFAVPAAVSLGGAFVPILGGEPITNYWTYFAQWYLSNALGALALGPIGIRLIEGRGRLFQVPTHRLVEAVVLGLGLILVCAFVFRTGAGRIAPSFTPAVLYLPLPLILWAAIRFGITGASSAVLVVAIVLIWRVINGPSPFVASDVETNVFAMQAFLLGLAMPALLLSATIEEAQRAAQTIKESEERFAFAASSASLGLWHYNNETDSFWMTEVARRMFGFQPSERITRQRIIDQLHPDDRHLSIFTTPLIASLGELTDTEFRVVLPENGVRWIRAQARIHPDDAGQVGEISGTFVDVTERKVADREAMQQRRELAHLTRVSMLAQLSGGIAHELTQPLTAILSNAQAARLLIDAPRPDLREIAEVLDDIIAEDNRAGEVIHRLRGLLKKGETRLEPVDVNELARSTLNLVHSELIGRRIRVNISLSAQAPFVMGDAVQLQQVVLNLLMNAADAVNEMPSWRRIVSISTRMTKEEQVEIVVADRGSGLPPTLQQQPFQPFFTTKEKGLGLGLSISSSIVKWHGSELRLDSNPDGGAVAWFSLATVPASDEHLELSGRAS
jgi:signal transduction histidine kinase